MGLSQDPSDFECTAFTYISMSLAHKYRNLKEPYNQGKKEQVTTKDRLYMKSQTQRHSRQSVFFKFNPLFVVLTFQIIY